MSEAVKALEAYVRGEGQSPTLAQLRDVHAEISALRLVVCDLDACLGAGMGVNIKPGTDKANQIHQAMIGCKS